MLGTQDFQLDRLLIEIDKLITNKTITEEVVIQGYSSLQFSNFKIQRFILEEDLEKRIHEADFVISHAGTGLVTKCLKMNKKIIIFPRKKEYNEHIDDHQLELAEVFVRKRHVLMCTESEHLIKKIKDIKTFIPVPFESNTENFLIFLNQLIDKI